jgi:glutamyl-tRNA reductase
MNLLSISISHHTAPIKLREALHLNSEERTLLLKNLKGNLFSEVFSVSTCNRTEIYGIPLHPGLTLSKIEEELISFKKVESVKTEHFRHFASSKAVEHLFRVITGIDSMLIGDNQIYTQIREAFSFAEQQGFAGLFLKRIFDAAIKTGKRAISETEISEGAVTVSYAAVQLIEKIFSSLSKKGALVIGAGETGEIAAKHLRDRGIGRLAITNRTLEKGEKVASNLKAKIIPFNTFKEFLHEYDIIISATSAPELILSKNDIEAAMKKRSFESMVIMDIAVPRDIDSSVREIDYVFYNDIDSLNIIVQQNLSRRKNEIPKVEKIIDQEVENFLSWFNSLEVAPTIKNLRDIFEAIRYDEVEKNKNKFSAEDREKLEIVTRRIINKILHHPTIELKRMNETKSHPDETAAKVSLIRDLFGLNKNGEEETEK